MNARLNMISLNLTAFDLRLIPKIYNKRRHSFYLLTGFAGLLLIYWEIHIYRLTLISIWVPLGIIAISAVLATLLDYRQYGETYNLSGLQNLFFAGCWNIASWGFLLCSAFILSNYYLHGDSVTRKEFEIVSRSSLPGDKSDRDKRKPTFDIRYKGLEKELVFEHRFYKWKDDYKSVILALEDGFWGYEIIRSKALTK